MINGFHSRSPEDFQVEASAILRLLRWLQRDPGRDVVLYPEPRAGSAWLGHMDPQALPAGEGLLQVYTSGTTGTPKVQTHPVRALFSRSRRASVGERWLLCYQPWRWAGLSVISHVVCTGGELVIPTSLSPSDLIDGLDRASHVSLTPSFLRKLAMTRNLNAPGVVQATLGGEWASQAALDLARNLFPNARISHVYASTEFGDICAASDGKAGYPAERLPDAQLGSDGELLIRGRPTGDLWELREGRYHFVGRKAEQISVGGALVAASVVEEAALTLAGVSQVRVFGIPNAILGQAIALEYVGSAKPEDLKLHLTNHLPKLARPMRVTRVEDIALSAAGKLSRAPSQ